MSSMQRYGDAGSHRGVETRLPKMLRVRRRPTGRPLLPSPAPSTGAFWLICRAEGFSLFSPRRLRCVGSQAETRLGNRAFSVTTACCKAAASSAPEARASRQLLDGAGWGKRPDPQDIQDRRNRHRDRRPSCLAGRTITLSPSQQNATFSGRWSRRTPLQRCVTSECADAVSEFSEYRGPASTRERSSFAGRRPIPDR
jgi:hypothetical protein